jgi:hypothetical protein
MQSIDPHILEPVAETFYKLMRQIYVEQVWRQSEQSATNPSQDRQKTELGLIRSAFLALSNALS